MMGFLRNKCYNWSPVLWRSNLEGKHEQNLKLMYYLLNGLASNFFRGRKHVFYIKNPIDYN